jgi:TetR/AcrR family transcriptional repressor of bet genes
MQATEKQVSYRRKSPAERRRELIDAGIACLADGGMSGFTIDRICTQAGVSRGLINHHFQTKDELLLQIYAVMTEHLLGEADSGNPMADLRAVIDLNFDERSFNAENLRAWLSVWGEISNNRPLFELHCERYQVYKARIEADLREIADTQGISVEAGRTSRQLIALIDGLWLEYCLHPEEFTLAMAREDCYHLLRDRGISL